MKTKTKKKLKTLKDIERFIVCSATLKEEAIKWLGKERTLNMNAQDFILVFFGITEEDLE
jgi:hypothetical protein